MANKMKAMLEDPKSRNSIITLGAVSVLGAAVLVVLMVSGNKKNEVTGTTRVAGPSSGLNTTPGGSDSSEYIAKLEQSNINDAEKALKSGKTSTGVLTGGSNLSDVSPLDKLGDAKDVKTSVVKEEVEITPPEAVVLPTVNVAAEPPKTQQVYSAAPAPKFGTTEDYHILQAASGIWTAKTSRSEYNYLGQGKPLEVEAQERVAQQQADAGTVATSKGQVVARTGDIINAVLETGINSDEPGPVLATIVSGQFKGARLVGAAKRRSEKMIVEFSTITIPGRATSSSISAVAIDIASMEQASTLASSVDNHYFKRYGLLFAAALMGGYSDAIKDQNTTQIITSDGAIITTNNGGQKTSKQINRESLGSVGKAIGQEVQRESSKILPTVKVNRGTAIGILLMDDLTLGK